MLSKIQESEISIVEDSSILKRTSPSKDENFVPISENRFVKIYKRIAILVVPFLISASILAYQGSFVDSTNLSEYSKIGLLSFLGFFIALTCGFFLEGKVRSLSRESLLEFLTKNEKQSKSNFMQVITYDYRILISSISYYLHDIVWIVSLMLVAMVSNMMSYGLLGNFGVILFLLVSLLSWRFLMPIVVEKRKEFVTKYNVFSSKIYKICTLSNFGYLGVVASELDKTVLESSEEFNDGKNSLYISKIFLSTSATFAVDILMIVTVYFGIQNNVSTELKGLLFAAIFSISGESLRLFFAISGLRANLISFDRLNPARYSTSSVSQELGYSENGSTLIIPPIDAEYSTKELSLDRGKIYSIKGNSGIGKSTYLKRIAMLNKEFPQIVYLDNFFLETKNYLYGEEHTEQELKQTLVEFIGEFDEAGTDLFILDEVLSKLDSVGLVKQFLPKLEKLAINGGFSIILVDHRINLPRTLEFSSLIK